MSSGCGAARGTRARRARSGSRAPARCTSTRGPTPATVLTAATPAARRSRPREISRYARRCCCRRYAASHATSAKTRPIAADVAWSVCHTTARLNKTIEMPFVVWTLMCPRNRCISGPDPPGKGQFMERLCDAASISVYLGFSSIFSSLLFFSRVRSEGWQHHGRILSPFISVLCHSD